MTHVERPRAELRQLVLIRGRGRCEGCGGPLGAVLELHHRQLLSQGGPDCACNVVALHGRCHNMDARQQSVHQQPRLSRANGLMVSAWARPEDQPVLIGALSAHPGGGVWVLLPCDSLRYVPHVPLVPLAEGQ